MSIGCGIGVTFGGTPLWTPKDLVSGVILQLDADYGITVTGAGISEWLDQSDGSNNATQTVDADRPAWGSAGLGGHRYAGFDSTNTEWMDLGALTDASKDYTVFAVLKPTATGTQVLVGDAGLRLFARAAIGAVGPALWAAAYDVGMAGSTEAQVLTWRQTVTGNTCDFYRDGKKLGSETTAVASGFDTSTFLGRVVGGTDYLDADLYYLVIVNRKCTDAEVALINDWLMVRFGLSATMGSIANLGAWWDLDHAVYGATLTSVTDRALAQTINVVGGPAIQTVDGEDFVRFDGANDVLWIADAAALDGAAGCTHVLKHANHEALPVNATLTQKGRSAVHLNGGLGGHGSAGTRLTALLNSGNVADIGPLAELTSPAETIAAAIDSGAAVRRVDGNGTYASNATAATTAVGIGSLTWGARETGAGAFDEYVQADLRAAAYYARDLNEHELKAAHEMLRDGP